MKNDEGESSRSSFPKTPWTMLMVAQGDGTLAQSALGEICSMYWFPIYAFARRNGHSAHDAEDMTQGFFAQLFRRESLSRADKEKGKLRTFLLGGMKYYMVQEWRKSHAEKRGGLSQTVSIDHEEAEQRYRDVPVDNETPEKTFERQWAITLLENTLNELEREYQERGKGELFAALRPCLTTDAADTTSADLAERTGMSEGNVRITVYRLRKRYRDLLKQFVSATVDSPSVVDDEITALFEALA